MATPAKRKRRVWAAYAFPGFRPQPTVRGVFGDPKARVITLIRRSKKHYAAHGLFHISRDVARWRQVGLNCLRPFRLAASKWRHPPSPHPAHRTGHAAL